jgi:hypothetical protein
MAPPLPPHIPAALANLCQLPGVKRSNTASSKNTTSTFRSKSSLDSRPTFTTQSSYNTTLDKVSFDSATDDSMSYTAPAQTGQWGWAKATNVDGVIKFTTLDGADISREKLVRKPSTDTGYRRTDTATRLSELRKLMRSEKIDY